ncbi:MAG: hypothetical protein RLZZ511_1015 [Cyanobacteriota bacterium]|jgi:tetratricopeptide (TPR) repeat protein
MVALAGRAVRRQPMSPASKALLSLTGSVGFVPRAGLGRSYQQALSIYQQVNDRNSEANALNNLGIIYLSLSQYDKAIAFYKQSVNVSESIRYDLQQLPQESQKAYTDSISKTYTDLAKVLKAQGRSSEAQAVLALLDRVPPNNPNGISLTPAEQKILAELSR